MKKIVEKIKKINKSYLGLALILLVLLVVFIANMSFADLLDNDVEVAPNSELTYYLNVNYDGVDRNGDVSDSGEGVKTIEVSSGEMIIEDKIPDGLTFTGFVTTDNGTIGAANRSDNTQCLGKVVDDTNEATNEGVWNADETEYTYHGLHYDAASRTVSFKVENLQAGCYLTVGVKTMTPARIDDPNTIEVEQRRDFYNFATARESSLTVNSNMTHVYMGKNNLSLYTVTYEYSGTVPANAPTAPEEVSYAVASNVSVANNVDLEGYTFSGWSSNDVTVNNGSFVMPGSNVVFTGSFTEDPKHTVTYSIDGDAPTNYVSPLTKQYYAGEKISLDNLETGYVIDGYRFLGWTSSDVTIENDSFEMPNSDVTITGSFEEITYTVTYAFYDTVLPENADSYLPATRSYPAGTIVTLSPVLNVQEGYEFLGWYEEDSFEMPAHNVTIYGEWKQVAGTFSPVITQTVVDQADHYVSGDVVTIQVTVTNPADFAINDVIVKLSNENITIAEGEGYTILSDGIVSINTIPAGESFTFTVSYVVEPKSDENISNIAEVKGASADDNHEFDLDNTDSSSTGFTAYAYGLKLYLVDRDNSETKLSDAVYSICTLADDDTTCFAEITTADGYAVYNGLSAGTYHVKQKTVTTGYVLDTDVHTIVINDENTDNDGYITLNLENRVMGSLPITGGIGTVIFTVVGLLIIVAGINAFINYSNTKDKNKKSISKKKKN